MSGTAEAIEPAVAVTASQRARRERMITTVLDLAAEGGYDAVQMREVAERAGVALGTLYRYFPSKVHLLVCALADKLESVCREIRADGVSGGPQQRVLEVISRITTVLGENRDLSAALVRALMFADATVSTEVEEVGTILVSTISWAYHGDDRRPSQHDAVVVVILGKVWLSDVVAWLGGRMSLDELREDLTLTARTLLPEQTSRR
jgi:AcrR family transcriptional regulator